MKNENNQKIVDNMRHKYLNNEITHESYYLWLADFIGASKRHLQISQTEINKSNDKHLNDIPLIRWDNHDSVIRNMAYAKGISWSLSDTVCVMKTIARNAIK